LDVHADTIAVAVAEPDGEVRPLGIVPNRLDSIRKLVAKLGPAKQLKVCYEAGPTGYVLYWQLTALGVACEVVAPSLVPVKAGDRVKTDRRDAAKLARSYRADDLTPVWVPDADHEALRDLVRAREDARQDQHRARHRLSKFLLRHGRRPPEDVKKHWTLKYMTWIQEHVHFEQAALEVTLLDYVHEVEHMADRIQRLETAITEAIPKAPPEMRAVIEALQALRGVAQLTAVTVVAELGSLSRFHNPRQLIPAETATRLGLEPASQRDGLESAVAAAHALQETGGSRQEKTADRDRGRPRVVGFHLGHRRPNRSPV
jgi:transposase